MHSLDLVHRDIKPENVMFKKPVEHYQESGKPLKVKLIDLGMCGVLDPKHPQQGCLGSPGADHSCR